MGTTVITKGQPGSGAKFRDTFLWHKLHSLSGILPIGLFLIFHLTANSYSLRGELEFNVVVTTIGYAPFVQLLEIAVILIPILFHAIYGLFIVAEMQGPGGNVSYYGYGRNWLYVLQRWSGVVALAYICFHVYDTTINKYLIEFGRGGEIGHAQGFQSVAFKAMAWRMANPLYLAFQLTGVAAAAIHLGNGILNFCIRWGITVGKEAQRIAATLGWALGLALTALGWWIAINFAMHGQPLRQQYPTLDKLVDAESQAYWASPNTIPHSSLPAGSSGTAEAAGAAISRPITRP